MNSKRNPIRRAAYLLLCALLILAQAAPTLPVYAVESTEATAGELSGVIEQEASGDADDGILPQDGLPLEGDGDALNPPADASVDESAGEIVTLGMDGNAGDGTGNGDPTTESDENADSSDPSVNGGDGLLPADANGAGDTGSDGDDATSGEDDTGSDGDDTSSGGDDTGSGGDDTGSGEDDTGSDEDDTGSDGDDTGSDGDDTGSDGDDTGSDGDDTGSDGDDAGSDGDDNTGDSSDGVPPLPGDESTDPGNGTLPDEWVRTDDSPMYVGDVLVQLNIMPATIVSGLALSFSADGEPVEQPGPDASLRLMLSIGLPVGVAAQLRQNDFYELQLPQTILPAQSDTLWLTRNDQTYARVELEASGMLRIVFEDAVRQLDGLTDSFDVSATFAPDAYAPGTAVTLTVPGEPAISASFVMAGEVADEDGEGENPDGEGTDLDDEEDPDGEDADPEDGDTDASKNADDGDDPDTPDPMEGDGPDGETGGEDDRSDDDETDGDSADTPAVAPLRMQDHALITGFSLTCLEDGEPTDTPTLTADVQVTFDLTIDGDIVSRMTEPQTYQLTMPQALAPADEQTVDIYAGDDILGTAHLGLDNRITLILDAQAAPEDGQDDGADAQPAGDTGDGDTATDDAASGDTAADDTVVTGAATDDITTDDTAIGDTTTDDTATGDTTTDDTAAPDGTSTSHTSESDDASKSNDASTDDTSNTGDTGSDEESGGNSGEASDGTQATLVLTRPYTLGAIVDSETSDPDASDVPATPKTPVPSDPIEGSFSFEVTFVPEYFQPGGDNTITLDDQPLAPSIAVHLAPDDLQEEPEEQMPPRRMARVPVPAWIRTDPSDPMDVKNIYQLLGVTPASILSSLNLSYTEPDGSTSGTSATIDAVVHFLMGLSIPQNITQNMRGGDTYTIDLPKEVTITQGGTYDLANAQGVVYAKAEVKTNGQVVITFTDNIQTIGTASGYLQFDASFNSSYLTTPGDHVVQIPNESQDLQSTVDIKSKQQQAIDKQGTPDKQYNPSQITWDVDFNKPLASLTNAIVSDAIPTGLTLQSVQVYSVQVDLDGNVLPGTETPMPAGSYTINGSSVSFRSPLTNAVRIRYVTDITGDTSAGGDISFQNQATLTASGVNLPTTATVVAHYGKFIEKANRSYDPIHQRFGWEIRYNYGQQTLTPGEAMLTDTLTGKGMVYDQDSILVRSVQIDATGKPTLGATLTPGTDYTLSFVGNQMVIRFPSGLTQAVNITYTTHIDGIVDQDGQPYSNDVSTSWHGTTHNTGSSKPTQQVNILKSLVSVDEIQNAITWRASVNRNHYTLTNWRLTDTFGTGLFMTNADVAGITVQNMDTQAMLTVNQDYTVTPAAGGFVINFINTYQTTANEFVLQYVTHYPDDDTITQLTNTLAITWDDTNGTPHTSTSKVTYPRTPQDIDNGTKYGTYNAVTKEITWYVLVSYNNHGINNAVLTDPIQSDQVYVHDSLRICLYDATAPNKIGAEVTPAGQAGYTVQEPTLSNSHTLTVSYLNVDDGITAAFWVIFNTSLAGQIVQPQASYTNNAVYTSGGDTFPLQGKVSIANSGSLVNKNGYQGDDGYVYWSAVINPSQSLIVNPVIVDTPSSNQRIDMASVKIYPTSVDASGKITPDRSQQVSGYTADYAQDASGTWVLTIRFAGQSIEVPYVLEYRSSLFLTQTDGTATNHISVTGDNTDNSTQNDTSSSIPVRVFQGGGTIYGEPGALTVVKQDATGKPLAGAVLVLEDIGGNRVGPVTTGASGRVVFDNIVQGPYKLYELSAPAGFTVSPTLANGMDITVDADTTNTVRLVSAVNDLTRASLRKVDQYGIAIPGVQFQLEQQQPDGSFALYSNTVYTSDINGMVVVTGLLPGTYRFVETAAAPGYIRNTQPRQFTLVAGSNGVIVPQNTGDMVNYQGAIRLLKTDPDGRGLQDAVFTLYAPDRSVVGQYATDVNGLLTISNIAPGTYTLRETRAPSGYQLTSDPISITIPSEAAGVVPPLSISRVVNRPIEGGIIVPKIDGDTGEPLEGAVLQVLDAAQNEVTRVTTGPDGTASFAITTPGRYTLRELQAPAGYVLNTATIMFTVTPDDTLSMAPRLLPAFPNHRGRVRLHKVDGNGNPLQGAVFTLYDTAGNALGTYQTNADGRLYVNGVPPGDYLLRETRGPIGYTMVSDPWEIHIPASNEGVLPLLNLGDVVNLPGRGLVVILKQDADGRPLAGATFAIIDASGNTVTTVTTHEDGMAQVESLAPGRYTAQEIQAPAGYIRSLDVLHFTITRAMTRSYTPLLLPTVINYQASLRLEKVDVNGNPLAGAVFSLCMADGETLSTHITGADGVLFIEGIAPGKYILRETRAPIGYALVDDPIGITIPDDAAGDPGVLELGEFINQPARGVVFHAKTDGDTGEALAGAVFVIRDASGEEVARLTTHTDGLAQVESMPAGTYTMEEISAPPGYILDTQIQTFTVTQAVADNNIPMQLDTVDNYRGRIRLEKTDAAGQALSGAEFTLYTNHRDPLGTYRSGPDGMVAIDDLAPGQYILAESGAPRGYVPDSDPMGIDIPYDANGRPPILNFGPIVNAQATGSVSFVKADSETGTRLAGAQFSLIDRSTQQEIERIWTDDAGMGRIDSLAPGDYSLIELQAPQGYILNTAPIDFTVTAGAGGLSEPVDLGTVENQQGSVQITKVDQHGAPVQGATFTLYSTQGQALGSYTSDRDGIVMLYQLTPGTYRIRETRAPHGYEMTTDPIDFTIPDTVSGIMPPLRVGPIVNYQNVGVVILRKEDTQGNPLQGAIFQLLEDDTGQELARITTDEYGYASAHDLPAGSYSFVELKAPDGYALDPLPLHFTIDQDNQTVPVYVTMKNSPISPRPPSSTPPGTPSGSTTPPGGPPKTGDAGNGPLLWAMVASAALFVATSATSHWLEKGRGRRKRGA